MLPLNFSNDIQERDRVNQKEVVITLKQLEYTFHFNGILDHFHCPARLS